MAVLLSTRLNRPFVREIAMLINGIGDPLSVTKIRLPLRTRNFRAQHTRDSASERLQRVSASRRVFAACALYIMQLLSELHSARLISFSILSRISLLKE